MNRKVVRHGPSSLTISLPSKWVKKYNLKAGDDIEVTEENSALVVRGKGAQPSKEVTIDIKEPLMKRMFAIPYLQGADIIRYRFSTLKQQKFIENNVELMYGFEIVRQDDKCITIKNIATVNENEFSNMVNRLFHLCTTMLELFADIIKTKNPEDVERLLSLEKSMTKIDLYCRRLINQESFHKSFKGSRYAMVRIVETTGDYIVTSTTKLLDHIKTNDQKAISIVKKLAESFRILEKIHSSRKIELLFQFKQLEISIKKDIEKAYDKKSDGFMFLNMKALYYHIHDLAEEMFFNI